MTATAHRHHTHTHLPANEDCVEKRREVRGVRRRKSRKSSTEDEETSRRAQREEAHRYQICVDSFQHSSMCVVFQYKHLQTDVLMETHTQTTVYPYGPEAPSVPSRELVNHGHTHTHTHTHTLQHSTPPYCS